MARNRLLAARVDHVLIMPAYVGAAEAADTGKAKATACADSHGADAKCTNDAPAITETSESAVAAAMPAYKIGAKEDKLMYRMAQTRSDEYVANLAACYATLK